MVLVLKLLKTPNSSDAYRLYPSTSDINLKLIQIPKCVITERAPLHITLFYEKKKLVF